MTDSKQCNRCQQVKPLSAFYPRSNAAGVTSECKECMKARSRATKPTDKRVALVASEALAIAKLHSLGIPALPGKALHQQWADVIAWGGVLIEVKFASEIGGKYAFNLSPTQVKVRLRGDLMILIARDRDGADRFHLFPASHPVFHKPDGRLKAGVTYTPVAHKYDRRNQPIVDAFAMARDNWTLIEQARQTLMRRLMQGDLPAFMKAA